MKLAFFGIAIGLSAWAGAQSQAGLPTDDQIRQMLVERVDKDRWGTGIVVGIISPTGRRIVSYGTLDSGDPRPVTGDTIFEIGSLTKVITSLVFANMMLRGEVKLDDPAQDLLPKGTLLPKWHDQTIRLVDLSTQTSGLPFFPTDLPEIDTPEAVPSLARYSEVDVYRFLAHYQLLHEIGVHWEYSNLGVGLLGTALASREGTTYEKLIANHVTKPLGMTSTFVTVPRSEFKRLSIGHDDDGKPAPKSAFPRGLEGAGSLRSTANDLLSLLNVLVTDSHTELGGAMLTMLKTTRPAADWLGYLGGRQALGWWVFGKDPGEMIAHAGDTSGFTCSMAYDPKSRIGVVALSNGGTGGDSIAMHILSPAWPYAHRTPPAPTPKEVPLPKETLDQYVGKYDFGPNTIMVVTRRGDHLTFMAPGSPMVRLHSTDEKSFFIQKVGVQVIFKKDANAKTTGMELHLPGVAFAIPGKKI